MRPLVTVVASLTVAALIALGGFWFGRASGAQVVDQSVIARGTQRDPPSPQDQNLAAVVSKLQRRLEAVERREALATATPPANPSSQEGVAEGEPFDKAKEDAKHLERVAAIEAAVESEARDVVWARPTEAQLHAAVDAAVEEGAKFSIQTVKCLTSVCEMVLAASGPDELKFLTHQLPMKIKGMGSLDLMQPTIGPDGTASVTCHLFREGFPRPDEGVM